MKSLLFFISSFFIIHSSFSQFKISSFQTLPGLSIRALEVQNDSTAWFAANRGVWGYTNDAGKNWHIDSIQVDSLYPEFRSIAVVNDSTVLLLSISSPAYLFKTTNKGKKWKLVYMDKRKDIFFDSMKFWDDKNGMALADPIDGKIQLINTHDGGETWKTVDEVHVPYLEKGEAFFAASNSCFDFYQQHSWIATGGKNSRVLHSSNGGGSHLSYDTPLPEGEDMTGIYSIDFFNSKLGIVGGGNYDKADTSITALAITNDGGKTWMKVKTTIPIFGSCVQFISKEEILITGSPGTFLYNLRTLKMIEIKNTNEKSEIYYTLRVSDAGNVVWLAGSDGRIAKILIK